MTAAASAAAASRSLVGEPAGAGEVAASLTLVVAGGLAEGTALGLAQSWAFRRVVPRLRARRYVLVTVLVAGLGWAAASLPGTLAGPGDGAGPPVLLVVAGGAGLGALMGAMLGSAQAVALRGSVARPGAWVPANAVAWTPAMAVVFLGATTAGGSWTVPVLAGWGAVTGPVAGAVLGRILGSWVPRLSPAEPGSRAR